MSVFNTNFNGFNTGGTGGGSDWQRKRAIKLKDGESIVVRVLPSRTKNVRDFAVFHKNHYGHYGVGKDPTKPIPRPFGCVEKKDLTTGQTKVACPKCAQIEAKKIEIAEIELNCKKAGKDFRKDKVWQGLEKWMRDNSMEKMYHLNVMLESGEFKVVKLGYKHFKLLQDTIDTLIKKKNINALDFNQGVWFELSKKGQGIDTQQFVNVVTSEQPTETGGFREVIKLAPISEEVLKRAEVESFDLRDSFYCRYVTPDQVRLLTEGSGDPGETDMILNLNTDAAPLEASPTPVAHVAAAVKKASPAIVDRSPEDEIASLRAALDKALAAKSSKPAAAPAVSDSEFDELLGD